MEGPRFIGAAEISSLLTYSALIDHLRWAFKHADTITAPPRQHYTLPCTSTPSSSSSSSPTLLLMPAWPISPSSSSSYIGVKLVTVFPQNSEENLPSVSACYLLSSALTGLPLAFFDGTQLTLWRTACVSGLASQYLANPGARVLLMVGAGALAPHLIKAHCAARPAIDTILIWNRTYSRAESLAQALQDEFKTSECKSLGKGTSTTCKSVSACSDLEGAVRMSDIVCCATLSEKPLVQGPWLKPGTHLDLVGSFTPGMRECDEDAIKQAVVFVDTPAALHEAGELAVHMLAAHGTLSELAKGEKAGRQHLSTFTVFKSVGCALVDLATAQLVYEKLRSSI